MEGYGFRVEFRVEGLELRVATRFCKGAGTSTGRGAIEPVCRATGSREMRQY